ncbi:MAG TPA: universal stress protein [Gemmatimonadaceae bacterium]|nr:universal stress protein [Gemmatimonadaceae bacterium]
MTHEIMVALDGSDKGRRALSVALGLAEIADTGVHLVRVVRPITERILNQVELLGLDPKNAPGRREAEEELVSIVRDLTMRSSRALSWELLEGADVAVTLDRVARERDVRALVMGTRGASSTGLAIFGSVADRVMRECPKPVVLVPPGAFDIVGKQIQIRRLLVPLDGSALAARSIDFLLEIPRSIELEFVLVEVVQNETDAPVAQRSLQSAADRLNGRSAEAVPRIVLAEDRVRAIVDAVREFAVDMIAMSTRGEGGLRRLVLGSVAEGVVRAAEVPVLLLTPTMLAAQLDPAPSPELTPHANA